MKLSSSLSVPNQLLFRCSKPRDYIPLLNNSIADKAVAIRPDCCQVADNPACHAGRLRSQVAPATSGKSEMLLGKCAHIQSRCGITVAPQPLLEEMADLDRGDQHLKACDGSEYMCTMEPL